MEIRSLGYVGIPAPRLDDWVDYGAGFLGLQLAERHAHEIVFRMDDRRRRIFIHDDLTECQPIFGWEVSGARDLDALGARLECGGVAVRRGSRAFAARRCVADVLAFEDAAGNRLEAFYGAETVAEAFTPGRAISAFKTGALGAGHVVLVTPSIDADTKFYRDILGFQVSDYVTRPFRATFFHVNPRHHSLALIEGGERSFHHLMLELLNLDDVGQAYDLALLRDDLIATTLGRHTNDYITSFYSYSPSPVMIELGWGGRSINPSAWTPIEMFDGPSFWGHERNWLSPTARAEARSLRLAAAAKGERAPVHVTEGNYVLAHSIDEPARGTAERTEG
jgi:2,3-dihydroxybiphenyl 1,2-dioxygenase